MKNESRVPVAKVIGVVLTVLSIYVSVSAFVQIVTPFEFQMSIPVLWLPLIILASGYRIWATKLLFVRPTDETYTQAE